MVGIGYWVFGMLNISSQKKSKEKKKKNFIHLQEEMKVYRDIFIDGILQSYAQKQLEICFGNPED